MRLRTLAGEGRGSGIDLRDAEGLVAFVSPDEADWREYVAVLRTAFGAVGGPRTPGPAVSGPDGGVQVGTPAFEALLTTLLEAGGIGREEFAALWYGSGAATAWLAAAGSLAERARRSRTGRAAAEAPRGTGSGRAEPEPRARTLRESAAAARARAGSALLAWVRERQDAETRLLLYRDRERELRRRVRRIEDEGGDAACSACGRPLGRHAEAVCAARREEWEAVVQDGKWWRRRRDQLRTKPRRVGELEERAAALEAKVGRLAATAGRRAVAEGTEVVDAARRRVARAVHGRAMALTGGRLAGAFPDLYAEWVEGARGGVGGEEMASIELAFRIAMVELALDCGLAIGSVLFPTGLERLNGQDLPRVLAELARLARRVPVLLVKVTPQLAAAAPECFDLLLRVEDSPAGRRVRRQRSGLGLVRFR